MSRPTAGVWCVLCLKCGHKCQAQIDDVTAGPICLACADGEPCSFERVAKHVELETPLNAFFEPIEFEPAPVIHRTAEELGIPSTVAEIAGARQERRPVALDDWRPRRAAETQKHVGRPSDALTPEELKAIEEDVLRFPVAIVARKHDAKDSMVRSIRDRRREEMRESEPKEVLIAGEPVAMAPGAVMAAEFLEVNKEEEEMASGISEASGPLRG